jgi:Putative Mg2+ and Co2+ transporter CorC
VIIESAHSRFPVISEHPDHIEGHLMVKDLLPFLRCDAEVILYGIGVTARGLSRLKVCGLELRAERVPFPALPYGYRDPVSTSGISGLMTIEHFLRSFSSAISKTKSIKKKISISVS